MKYELIEKKQDGSRVKVIVTLLSDWSSTARYNISVETCAPKKRTWKPTIDGNDYSYRKLSMEDRKKICEESDIKAAGIPLINRAMLEAWEKAKPDLYKEQS